MRFLPLLLLTLAARAAAETCADKGLYGACNGCTCCCSRGSLILRFVPQGCECARRLDVGDVAQVLAVGSAILLPSFLAGLYFASGRAFAPPGGLPMTAAGPQTPRTLAWTAAERRRMAGVAG